MNFELLQSLAPAIRGPIEQEWTRLAKEQERLAMENKLLQDLLRLERIKRYGAKSEQLSDQQFRLLDLEPGVTAVEVATEAERSAEEKEKLEEPTPAAPTKPGKLRHPGRHELPAHLPRVEQILVCTAEQCHCGACGAATKVIGYDRSEEIDVKPAEFFVRVIKREKRACGQCLESTVEAAPLPPKIVEKGKASNAMVVDVIMKKYGDHLPLYRQAAILRRDVGLDLSPVTLCGWVMQGGSWLESIRGALRADLLAGSYIQADETPVGVQTEEKGGSNHRAYLWQYSRPGGPVVFDFQMGRGREGPRAFLGKYGGCLQSDGYGAYDQIGGAGLVHCGCMAHVRRGFVDALKVAPGDAAAAQIVSLIAQLYAVEKQARESGLSHAERKSLREQASVPALSELKALIIATRREVLPKGALGKACDYALGQWTRVSVYAERGEVEIDNNWCENAMRPTVLGRKNWLHIGSEDAGPRIAAITSVLETCRRIGVNPREYLLDVLPRIPDWPANRIAELTPMAWQASRTAA